MKWTVPQNSFQMLLLVSCSDGCHFNSSPNELQTCQLHLINSPASGLSCTIPQKWSLQPVPVGDPLHTHFQSPWLTLLTSYLPTPPIVFSLGDLATHSSPLDHGHYPCQPLSVASSYLPLPLLHQTTIIPLSELYLGLMFSHKWTSSSLYLKLESKCLRTLRGIRKTMHLLQ